jgi:hypothetical protein
MLHFRVLNKDILCQSSAVFKKNFTFTFIMRNDSNIYDQIRQAKSENVVTGYSSDPDKIVWENLDNLS